MMRKKILTAVSLILFSTVVSQRCSQPNNKTFINVTELKNNTPQQAIHLLGIQPDSSFNKRFVNGEKYVQLYYKPDSAEFRYVKGSLAEIIVHKPSFGYKPENIEKYGLSYQPPSQEDSAGFFRWYNYPDFKAVSFYRVGSKLRNKGTCFKVYFNYR
jgi:hypothetical protein